MIGTACGWWTELLDHLGCQAALPEAALLRHWVLDDLGLRHQHVHQVTTRHQVKQEVQVVWVLQKNHSADTN
jgi:hypothetical protein